MAENGSGRREVVAVLAAQFGVSEEELPAFMADRFGERIAEGAIAAGGAVWTDDSPLTARERSLLVLAALVTQGGVEARLRAHFRLALHNGVTPDELDAAVAFLAVYVGYPRATAAIEALRDELVQLEMR
jgi:4-carboxymuconolactone decarboxylase